MFNLLNVFVMTAVNNYSKSKKDYTNKLFNKMKESTSWIDKMNYAIKALRSLDN